MVKICTWNDEDGEWFWNQVKDYWEHPELLKQEPKIIIDYKPEYECMPKYAEHLSRTKWRFN